MTTLQCVLQSNTWPPTPVSTAAGELVNTNEGRTTLMHHHSSRRDRPPYESQQTSNVPIPFDPDPNKPKSAFWLRPRNLPSTTIATTTTTNDHESTDATMESLGRSIQFQKPITGSSNKQVCGSLGNYYEWDAPAHCTISTNPIPLPPPTMTSAEEEAVVDGNNGIVSKQAQVFLMAGFQMASNARQVEVYIETVSDGDMQQPPFETKSEAKLDYVTTCRGIPVPADKLHQYFIPTHGGVDRETPSPLAQCVFQTTCALPGGPRPVSRVHLKFLSLQDPSHLRPASNAPVTRTATTTCQLARIYSLKVTARIAPAPTQERCPSEHMHTSMARSSSTDRTTGHAEFTQSVSGTDSSFTPSAQGLVSCRNDERQRAQDASSSSSSSAPVAPNVTAEFASSMLLLMRAAEERLKTSLQVHLDTMLQKSIFPQMQATLIQHQKQQWLALQQHVESMMIAPLGQHQQQQQPPNHNQQSDPLLSESFSSLTRLMQQQHEQIVLQMDLLQKQQENLMHTVHELARHISLDARSSTQDHVTSPAPTVTDTQQESAIINGEEEKEEEGFVE